MFKMGLYISFEEVSFDWKLKVLVNFVRVKSDQRLQPPPTLKLFSPKCIRLKLEKVILFKKCREHIKMPSGRHKPLGREKKGGKLSHPRHIRFLFNEWSHKFWKRLICFEIESSSSLF
jgi:hypothetical protein